MGVDKTRGEAEERCGEEKRDKKRCGPPPSRRLIGLRLAAQAQAGRLRVSRRDAGGPKS
jgi:hypothetical protein